MKKVLIIGSGGAGKSTFAGKLHQLTGIEIFHLDKLYWKPNWTETSKDEWRKTIEILTKKDSWIMDGNYSGTLEMRLAACDTVVFLDLPRALCVWRVLKRAAFYNKKVRPDMAEGCDEKLDFEYIKFIKWIWDYPSRSKPKVEALLKQFQDTKQIIRLKTIAEVENFFFNLSSGKVKSS